MRRLLLFTLLAGVVAALVNPGNFGTVDTHRRMQVARWIWEGQPQVVPGDPGFGLPGKDGTLQAWYGIGQSLVLVPFDVLVAGTVLPVLRHFQLDPLKQQQVEELLVAFLMQWLLAAGALELAYQALILLEFTAVASVAGALSLLFGTTYLQYVQCAQENNLILLTGLAALYGILRFRQSRSTGYAALAGAACGFAVLTRLPSLLETSVFFAFGLCAGGDRKRFASGFLPPVLAAILIGRWYQWIRFGNLFGTYISGTNSQIKGTHLSLSAHGTVLPFSFPLRRGLAITLFSANKSIFLFDPLLVMVIVIVVFKWRYITQPVRRVLAWMAGLLLLYIGIFSHFFGIRGDLAWGNRFLTLPVELLALLAVPLLVTMAGRIRRWPRRAAWVLVGASILLQVALTTLPPNLEARQGRRGIGMNLIADRAINLFQIAFHRENPARFARIPVEWRTLYYLPFQLRFRFPQLAGWAIAIWGILLISAPFLVIAVLRSVRPAQSPVGVNVAPVADLALRSTDRPEASDSL